MEILFDAPALFWGDEPLHPARLKKPGPPKASHAVEQPVADDDAQDAEGQHDPPAKWRRQFGIRNAIKSAPGNPSREASGRRGRQGGGDARNHAVRAVPGSMADPR